MILKLKRNANLGVVSVRKRIYTLLDKNNIELMKYKPSFDKNIVEFNIQYGDQEMDVKVPMYSFAEKTTIYKSNEEFGFIKVHESDKAIDFDYYWDMNYNGRNIKLYEIGFGSKGIYFVIKENNKTLAIISSIMISKNYEENYDLFIENNDDCIIAIICAVCWNLYRGEHREGASYKFYSHTSKTLTTLSKNIKNEMDFDFINNIASEENYQINNLNKRAFIEKIVGFSLFIGFIIFLIIMLAK